MPLHNRQTATHKPTEGLSDLPYSPPSHQTHSCTAKSVRFGCMRYIGRVLRRMIGSAAAVQLPRVLVDRGVNRLKATGTPRPVTDSIYWITRNWWLWGGICMSDGKLALHKTSRSGAMEYAIHYAIRHCSPYVKAGVNV